MARSFDPNVGSESFVDVVANLIGILVVLVAVVGLSVRTRATDANEVDRLRDTLRTLRASIASVERELAARGEEQADLEQRLERLEEERAELERELTQLRTASAATAAENRQLAAERDRLEQALRREADPRPAQTTAPTRRRLELKAPVSRPVAPGEAEIHFELTGGRVVYIPLDSLLAAARVKRQELQETLVQSGQAEAVVGPVGEYLLRFRVALDSPSLAQRVLAGSRLHRARLVEWKLVPVHEERGEPVARAVGERGSVRAILAGRNPRTTFVTVWVYPDSFAAFREFRDALYELGYPVAARPLPEGVPIAGSIDGSRSYAQ